MQTYVYTINFIFGTIGFGIFFFKSGHQKKEMVTKIKNCNHKKKSFWAPKKQKMGTKKQKVIIRNKNRALNIKSGHLKKEKDL